MREDVIWIGGGTGAGKTTVARILSRRYGLRLFAVDSFWYAHAERLGEREPSPEEQWLGRSPAEQADDFERGSAGRTRLVLADLDGLPQEPGIVVEGPQILPELLPDGARAVFLVATAELQRSRLATRPIAGTSRPELAVENRIEKDRLFAARVARRAEELGLPAIRVDGTRAPTAIAADVEHAIGPVSPAPPSVDLGAVRHWENEAYAANVRAWLRTAHAPDDEPVLPFACECGGRRCDAFAELTIDRYDAAERVLASGH